MLAQQKAEVRPYPPKGGGYGGLARCYLPKLYLMKLLKKLEKAVHDQDAVLLEEVLYADLSNEIDCLKKLIEIFFFPFLNTSFMILLIFILKLFIDNIKLGFPLFIIIGTLAYLSCSYVFDLLFN